MGSYGLPALAIKPPQQEDLLSKVGQITQLKSMMQAQQLQKGQLAMQPGALQAEQMKNQATAQDLQDNQIFTRAHQDAGGDWDKTISLATKYGASEKAIQTRRSGMADFQKKLTDKTKDDLANLKSQSEMVAQQAGAALQAPAEQRPALVKQGLAQMVQAGVLKPEDAQAQYQQYQQQGDDFLKSHMAGAITAQQQIENAAKKQDQALALHAQQFKETGISAEQAQTAAQKAQELRLASQRNFYEGQRVGLEGQRVGIEQQKLTAGVIPLDQVTNTTKAGRPYISMDDLPKDKYGSDAMKRQAAAAGIPVVNKDTASMLQDIDTAKANQQYMLDAIGKKLASGAPERLWYGPANTIEKMMQTDPDMASVGTFRTAAIQSLRAVAGSKGLRINQAEIKAAQDNDVPKLTDTLPVAQKKLQNMGQFMEDIEAAHLNRNRQANAPQQAGTMQPAGGGKVLSSAAIQQAAKDHGVSVDEAARQAKAAGYTIQ
jgi:hypothetical protein